MFPVTDKARTVLDALVNRCNDLGVSICPYHRVTHITRLTGPEAGFVIHHTHGTLRTKKVILASGGRSLPKTGSDGFGYLLARSLGHGVTATTPGLTPLILDDVLFHRSLSGVSQSVTLTTMVNGRAVDQRKGSLLWTHFGISGPVVMDASRWWTLARETGSRADLYGNFLPDKTQEEARRWFIGQVADAPRRSLVKTFAQLVPERFAEALCRHFGCNPQEAIAQLRRKNRDHILTELTRFRFPIVQDRGWKYAEVTAGGVPLEEISFKTMESKLAPGLYLIGEILDCDGRIGGFNFQWAWATGFLVGRAVADGTKLKRRTTLRRRPPRIPATK